MNQPPVPDDEPSASTGRRLTARQTEVLNFIRAYRKTNGFAPSLREIGDALGISSTNGVTDHVRALERKGYLAPRRAEDKSRSRAIVISRSAPSPLPPMNPQVVDSDRDLWLMLLSTVRYSLGRSSFVVHEACELVRRYRSRLNYHQIAQLAREVRESLDRAELFDRTLGDECDHRSWQRLVGDLSEPEVA